MNLNINDKVTLKNIRDLQSFFAEPTLHTDIEYEIWAISRAAKTVCIKNSKDIPYIIPFANIDKVISSKTNQNQELLDNIKAYLQDVVVKEHKGKSPDSAGTLAGDMLAKFFNQEYYIISEIAFRDKKTA